MTVEYTINKRYRDVQTTYALCHHDDTCTLRRAMGSDVWDVSHKVTDRPSADWLRGYAWRIARKSQHSSSVSPIIHRNQIIDC